MCKWCAFRVRSREWIGRFIGICGGCVRGSFKPVWGRSCRSRGGTYLGVKRFSESFRAIL